MHAATAHLTPTARYNPWTEIKLSLSQNQIHDAAVAIPRMLCSEVKCLFLRIICYLILAHTIYLIQIKLEACGLTISEEDVLLSCISAGNFSLILYTPAHENIQHEKLSSPTNTENTCARFQAWRRREISRDHIVVESTKKYFRRSKQKKK